MRRLLGSTVVSFLLVFFSCSRSNAGFAGSSVEDPGHAKRDKLAFSSMSSVRAVEPKKKYKDYEILVKFKKGVSEENKHNLHKKHGAERLKEFPSLRLHHVKLNKGMSVEEGVKLYQADPVVEYAEPNFLYSVQGVPNDPRFGDLWGLSNTGQTGGTAGADIKATNAWDITTGSSDVVVAIIDTGIDYTHPDLAGNMWTNVGFDACNQDSDPFDDHGHGTHVAGTIGALGNNSTGVTGVNWNVKLTACKFLDASGGGYTDGAIQCLQYIKDMKDGGANIVATNNSWGGGPYSQALYDAINAQRDILFIAAAGNSGVNTDVDTFYPADYNLPNVIAVGATDHNDNNATFSNYGRRSVHVSAPGVNILSTLPTVNEWNMSGRYGVLSGTSMATPHVTGLTALIKAQNPGRNWIAIKNLLLTGGDTVPNVYERTITGKRLNAYGSLTCSDKPLFSVLQHPTMLTVGTPITLSAVSVNCEAVVGPVTVTLPGGEVVTLHDDGVAPDLAAGDGVFSATWTPTRTMERLRFSSPAGTETIELPPISIVTGSLPSGSPNVPYRQSLQAMATAGSAPFTWSVVFGSLPPSITLDGSTGEVTGSPTTPGAYYFTVQVVDAFGAKSIRELSIFVNPAGVEEAWRKMAYTHNTTYIFVDYAVGNVADIAVDGSGNAYVTRVFYLADGRHAYYLVKYDSSGNELWSNTSVYGDPKAVAVDKDGYIYVGGMACTEGGNCVFDRYLLAKYDPQGNVVWTGEHAASGGMVSDVVTDNQGNVYITGEWGGYHTVKFDPFGNEVWARTANIENKLIWTPHIAADGNGNVYLTGYSYSSADPNMDVVLMKYDSAGNLLWSKLIDNGGKETGQDVAVDNDGNLYVTGWSIGAPSRLLLMKLDSDGNPIWHRSYEEGFETKGFGLAVDAGNNVYVTGSILGSPYGATDFLTLKYDSAGNVLSTKMVLDNGGAERGERLAIGPSGDIYVTGSGCDWTCALTIKYNSAPPLAFTTTSLPPATAGNAYVARISSEGGAAPYDWSIASGSLPTGLSLEITTSGSVRITGVPTKVGDYSFVVQLRENAGTTITRSLSISVDQPSLILTLTGDGSGGVSLPTGESCHGNCQLSFPVGTNINLTPVPNSDSLFSGWGGACTGGGSCVVTIDGDRQVTATFTKLPTISYARLGAGAGKVTFTPGTDCTNNCTQSYAIGTQVTLSATADATSAFAGWQGACTGTGNCTLTMGGDRQVTATFLPKGKMFYSVAAGSAHTLALAGNGQFWIWGDDATTIKGQLCPTKLWLSGVADVAAGTLSDYSLALMGDGTVRAWGYNFNGQLGDGTTWAKYSPTQIPGLTGVAAIAGGTYHSIILKRDGTVWTSGDNSYGQLGDGTTINRTSPVQVPGLSGVVAIAGGVYHTVALKGDGTVWTWGANGYGQLGDGATISRNSPVQVPGIARVVAIAGGGNYTIALKWDGTVRAWGDNGSGQLGDGTTTRRTSPVQVSGLSGIIAIAGGDSHAVALKEDGTVWTWGSNGWGQLGDGTTTFRTSPVQVPGLSDGTGVAAGWAYTVAAKGDGTVWAWGYNDSGQLGDGTTVHRSTPVQLAFDSTPPVITVTPPGGTYYAPQTVTLTANEPATIYYSLDGGMTFTTYSVPITISTTATLGFYAVDTARNQTSWRSEVYIIRDAVTAVITGVPASPTNATSATFTISGANVVAYKYRLDAGAYSAEALVATPISLVSLGEGTRTLFVIGRDSVGNWQMTPTTATWVVDLTAPTVSIGGTPVTSTNAIFFVRGTDVVAYKYALDGGAYSAETAVITPITLVGLSAGQHTVTVIGKDSAGNWQVTPTTVSWTVDGWPVSLPGGGNFRTILEAYTSLAGDNILQVKGVGLVETLLFNRNVKITLRGGYEPTTGTASGVTTLYGSLEISDGEVDLENLVLVPSN